MPCSRLVRGSHRRCSARKDFLRNFVTFTRKHLCQSLFFNNVAGLRPEKFIKKEALGQVFSCEFCEVSKNTFYKEHLWAATSGLPNLLPSSESLAIGSVSYAATVYQPRTDLSAILINLFLRFSFAVKSSQRSLASLVFSFFNADESF